MQEVTKKKNEEKVQEQKDLKKGNLEDNTLWIFDSYGKPINLRSLHRKPMFTKKVKVASTMPRYDPNKTCNIKASRVTKSIAVPHS